MNCFFFNFPHIIVYICLDDAKLRWWSNIESKFVGKNAEMSLV